MHEATAAFLAAALPAHPQLLAELLQGSCLFAVAARKPAFGGSFDAAKASEVLALLQSRISDIAKQVRFVKLRSGKMVVLLKHERA